MLGAEEMRRIYPAFEELPDVQKARRTLELANNDPSATIHYLRSARDCYKDLEKSLTLYNGILSKLEFHARVPSNSPGMAGYCVSDPNTVKAFLAASGLDVAVESGHEELSFVMPRSHLGALLSQVMEARIGVQQEIKRFEDKYLL